MTRNLKVLGLALIAVLAMSAIAAQAASATNHEFEATKAPAVATGEQIGEHEFKAGAAGVKCTTATFSGTQLNKTADLVRVHPTYGKGGGTCKLGAVAATVTTTGCDYVFESDTNGTGHATVRLDCGHSTTGIVIAGGGCTINISDTHPGLTPTVNQSLSGVTYENAGDEKTETEDVVVKATVTGITYIATGANCALVGVKTGTQHDGTYTGSSTLKGYEDKGGPFVPGGGTDSDAYTEGAHVGLRIKLNTAG